MTWQEELRRLDEDFSAGKLTADDYRARRDQVLASAVAPSGPQQGHTQQGHTQQGQPQQEQVPQAPATQGQAPQGEPQPLPQGQGNSDGGGNAESTQVIAPVSPPYGVPQYAPPGAAPQDDRTQAMSHWQSQQQGTASPATGFPAPQGPASPAGGFPAPQGPASPAAGFPAPQGAHGWDTPQDPASPAGGFPQQSWNEPQEDVSPPWGGSDLPPLAPTDNSAWLSQGPESFEKDAPAGKRKMVGGLVALVVLVAIAFGAWWLFGKDSGGGTVAEQTPASASPTASAPPAEPEKMPIGEFEGTPEPRDDIKDFAAVPGLNYLNPAELAAYRTAKAGEVNFHVQLLPDGGKAVLLLSECTDAKSAAAAAKKLSEIQVSNGAKKFAGAPKGIYVTEYTDPKKGFGQIRAHYASGNVVVRIESLNNMGIAAARADFDKVLKTQLDLMPAHA